VPELLFKSLGTPDNVIDFPGMRARVVELDGEWRLSRLVIETTRAST
jgi:hypothetical protein